MLLQFHGKHAFARADGPIATRSVRGITQALGPKQVSGGTVSNLIHGTLLGIMALGLAACSSKSPGPIEGTWKMTDPFPVTVSFRYGEVEALGAVNRASYKRHWNGVSVTYEEGANKGATFRYTVVDADTIRSDSGTFHRKADAP